MRSRLAALAIAVLVSVACGSLVRAGVGFRHATHSDSTCETCHPGAGAASGDGVGISSTACEGCHDSPPEVAHAAPWRGSYPGFTHGMHVAAGTTKCDDCHDASQEMQVMRSTCTDCHHHAPDYLRTHGLSARGSEGARCASCHRDSQDCIECHAGENVMPVSHPRDYIFAHAQDAVKGTLDCAACHDERGFCTDCHVARRVIPADHSEAGWWDAAGGLHADAARRDLESCARCHDAGGTPTCASCHS